MVIRIVRFVLVSAVSLSACLAAAELGRRVLDGDQVWSLELKKDPDSLDLAASSRRSAASLSMEPLLSAIPRDAEADPSWFADRPLPFSAASPRWADERRAAFEPESNYIWNAATLGESAPRAFLQKNQGRLQDIFTFRPPGGGRHPLYRLYPEIQTGFGFTNQFGWRGPPIRAEKPPNVVRIGVLGDSTTFGYPNLLEHWLNLWSAQRNLGVRFEVLNTARPSIGALDAAAILDFELDAVDPDYVLLYGFGNGIYAADALVGLPPGVVRGQPPADAFDTVARIANRVLQPAARWSAAAVFLQSRFKDQRGGPILSEPEKPKSQIAFPPDISEESPDPDKIAAHTGGGLMFLDAYLQALNQIDAIAKDRGLRVFIGTFRTMAFDGMRLNRKDVDDGKIIYDYINKGPWWPNTYAQIHRLNDFYNRALRAWAAARGHHIIPVNEQMPWIPELYHDGIHELLTGEALHAWIVLQQLMPAIRDDLARHRLPHAGPAQRQGLESYWTIDRTRVAAALSAAAPAR